MTFDAVVFLSPENPFLAAEELTGCSPTSPCIHLPSVAPTPKPLSTAAHRWRSSGRKSGVSKRAVWGLRRSSRPPPRPSPWMVRAGPALWVSCQGRSQPTKSVISRDGVPAARSEGGQAIAPSRQESLRIPARGCCSLGVVSFSSNRLGTLMLLTFTSVDLTFRVARELGGREEVREICLTDFRGEITLERWLVLIY